MTVTWLLSSEILFFPHKSSRAAGIEYLARPLPPFLAVPHSLNFVCVSLAPAAASRGSSSFRPPSPSPRLLRTSLPRKPFFSSPPPFLSLQSSTTSPTDFVGKVLFLPRVTIPTFEIYHLLHRPGQVGTHIPRSFSFLSQSFDTPYSRAVLRLSGPFVFGQIESDIAGRVQLIKSREHKGRQGRYTQTITASTSVTFPTRTIYTTVASRPGRLQFSHDTRGLLNKTARSFSTNTAFDPQPSHWIYSPSFGSHVYHHALDQNFVGGYAASSGSCARHHDGHDYGHGNVDLHQDDHSGQQHCDFDCHKLRQLD